MPEPFSKAEEALKAAELCFENGLFDSCTSRSYYAMFWAAIAVLENVGYPSQKWSHPGLWNIFGREIVKKRKLYPSKMGGYLGDGYDLRRRADYGKQHVGKRKASRILRWAKDFVQRAKEVIEE